MQFSDKQVMLFGFLALALEVCVCIGIAQSAGGAAAASILSAHTVVVVVYASLLSGWLHGKGVDAHAAFWFPAVLMFCLPAFGVLGVTLALVWGLGHPTFKLEQPMEITEFPRLPHRPPELEKNLKFASGGLGDILRHSGDTAKRVLAVTAASRMTEREAIPFLKLAMSDAADEVRLLAFSVKDKIETGINQKIKHNLAELPNVPERDRPTVHRALAFLYWELVYLDIAEGDLREFMMAESDHHAQVCLESSNEASLHTLRGRIALERRNATDAKQHFNASLTAGAEIASVATYLAEAAFLEDDFTGVQENLAELPLHFRATAPYHALCRTWGLA